MNIRITFGNLRKRSDYVRKRSMMIRLRSETIGKIQNTIGNVRGRSVYIYNRLIMFGVVIRLGLYVILDGEISVILNIEHKIDCLSLRIKQNVFFS